MMRKQNGLFFLIAKMKLMRKLLLSYFILIIIPLILITTVFSGFTTKFTVNNITYSSKQSFNQAYSFLTFKLFNIREISSGLIRNTEFIDLLRPTYNEDILDSIRNMNSILKHVSSLQDGKNVTRVRVYVPDGLMYSDENKNIFNIKRAVDYPWYKELINNNKTYVWAPSSYLESDEQYYELSESQSGDTQDILSFCRVILNPDNYLLQMGLLRFDFPKNSIAEILKNANMMSSSFTFIINSNGELVASSDDTLFPQYNVNKSLIMSLSSEENNWIETTLGEESFWIGSRLLDSTDWYIVTILPSKEVLKQSESLKRNIILIVILVSTIAIFAAYAISYSINERIRLLAGKMRDVQSGKLEKLHVPYKNDEINMLIEDYNYMTQEMARLIEEQYKSGQELKNLELKALQAQINPHFLYNTLDMINWYAWNNSGREIISIVEHLAKFYKLSLSSGKDIITIGEELEHVLCYFEIQKMRFGNLILHINVEEIIKKYNILKTTLQPIVENAILHGILYKESKSGSVTISGALLNGVIELTVSDDGIGIPEEKLALLQKNKVSTKGNRGYGIKNVKDRIQLHYGNEYGLIFNSEYGRGTYVTIRIPAILENGSKDILAKNNPRQDV
jgi:two-component system sensor histidine kinase YesM